MLAVFVGIATWMCTMVYYEKNPSVKYVEKEIEVPIDRIVEVDKIVYIEPKAKCELVIEKE